MAKHGGLDEILRTRRCPGIRTGANFTYRDVLIPGVPPPPGGWPTRRAQARALAAQGREGELDDPATFRHSRQAKALPPVGSVVDADGRVVAKPSRRTRRKMLAERRARR